MKISPGALVAPMANFSTEKTIVLGGDVPSGNLQNWRWRKVYRMRASMLDIGMSGTEEIYFATFHLGVDGVE